MSLRQWLRFLFSLDYRRPPEPKSELATTPEEKA